MNFLLIVLSIFVTTTSSSTITWNYENVTVKQSDIVNLTCTVTDVTNLDVIRIDLRTFSGDVRTVADNVDVKLPFSKLKRYAVNYRDRNHVRSLTILYNGVRGEDAGHLSCYLLSDKTVTADLHLVVNVPVKEVFLMAVAADGSRKRLGSGSGENQLGENDSGDINLRETEETGVICVGIVDGTSTPPNLSIAINGQDRNQYFIAAEEAKTVPKADDLDSLRGEMMLTSLTMSPEREWNEQRLVCTAVSDGFPPVSVSATLRVEYVPALSCSGYEYYGLAGESVTISCQVSANPSSRVTWSRSGEELTGVRYPVGSDENIELTEVVVKPDQTSLTLRIRSIDPSQYGMYFLSAENEIGSAEVAIVLHPATGGGAADMSASGMGQFAALQQMLPPGMQMPSANSASTWRPSVLVLVLVGFTGWIRCRMFATNE